MSDNRYHYGWIAELISPRTPEEAEALNDFFNEKKLPYMVNYEGTLIYETVQHEPLVEAFTAHILPRENREFTRNLDELEIFAHDPYPFVSLYYDGSDNPIDDMTCEDFNARLKEENQE